MKKIFILSGLSLLSLSTLQAQNANPKSKTQRIKNLMQSRLNDLQQSNNLNIRAKGDNPLSQSRRIVKQEVFSSDYNNMSAPFMDFRYGYTSLTKGQEFHPNMIAGFPMDISLAGKSDNIIFPNEILPEWSILPEFVFPANALTPEIVIDSLSMYEEGDFVRDVIVNRSANNRLDAITKREDYGNGDMYISKSEKFYTNNLLSRVDDYTGDDLSNLELESSRFIKYDNNQKITTDTAYYYYQGALDGRVIFNYTYNANGNISQINFSSDFGDSVAMNVSYYTDGRFKQASSDYYYDGDIESKHIDSVGYANNGFIGYRKITSGNLDMNNNIEFEYTIIDFKYNSNLLDTFQIHNIDNGNELDNVYGIYKYSVDNNPDSLLVYYQTNGDVEEKMVFYYEPYNSTSVKKIAKNNNFNIFPNPVESFLNVYNKTTLQNNKATIQITDIKGARIWETTQALQAGVTKIQIPSSLAAGTYVVNIIADNSIFSQKILKK